MSQVEPVLKWVGGKRSSLQFLEQQFPNLIEGRYFEPFLGGGAVGFSRDFPNMTLSDTNRELINFYRVIRDSPQELIDKVKQLEVSKDSYYKIRAWDRDDSYRDMPDLTKAARTYFLNRCGYNGLYRVNRDGYFNVPFGQKSHLKIDEEKMLALSEKLNGRYGNSIELTVGDFEESIEKASEGDLVYLDPPYVPVSRTSNFVSYAQEGFSGFDHERLAKAIERLNQRRVLVIMSNSDSERTFDLFAGLGSLRLVPVRRLVSAKLSSRSIVSEVLFTNFEKIRG